MSSMYQTSEFMHILYKFILKRLTKFRIGRLGVKSKELLTTS